MSEVVRCGWCGTDPLYVAYHDHEWGVPVRDDRDLFAKLMLDGFQAGLSWITILRKREAFSRAFDGWDPEIIARYGDNDIARLMNDHGIVRNRLKVNGAVKNANAWLAIRDRGESFSKLLWSFVDGEPVVNSPVSAADIPTTSPEAVAMSTELRKRGFTFVGPTICYAFMQAVGMIDDHIVGCVSKGEHPI